MVTLARSAEPKHTGGIQMDILHKNINITHSLTTLTYASGNSVLRIDEIMCTYRVSGVSYVIKDIYSGDYFHRQATSEVTKTSS